MSTPWVDLGGWIDRTMARCLDIHIVYIYIYVCVHTYIYIYQ